MKNKEVALLETFLRATTQKGTTGTTEGTMQSTKMSETSGPWEAIGPLTAPISKWCYGVSTSVRKNRLHIGGNCVFLCDRGRQREKGLIWLSMCERAWSFRGEVERLLGLFSFNHNHSVWCCYISTGALQKKRQRDIIRPLLKMKDKSTSEIWPSSSPHCSYFRFVYFMTITTIMRTTG